MEEKKVPVMDAQTEAIVQTIIEEGLAETQEEALEYAEQNWVKTGEAAKDEILILTGNEILVLRAWFESTLGAREFNTAEAQLFNKVMGHD